MCVRVCVVLALALSPPQTSPLMFSHWRSSHSQFLPWMRVSPGGWQVHCPHRHWPTKKHKLSSHRHKVSGMSFTCLHFHTDTADVWNGWFCTQIDLPDKMSPGIVENPYVNHSLVWTLTHPHTHIHLEKLSSCFSQSVTREWTEWAFIMCSDTVCNTCLMIFAVGGKICTHKLKCLRPTVT